MEVPAYNIKIIRLQCWLNRPEYRRLRCRLRRLSLRYRSSRGPIRGCVGQAGENPVFDAARIEITANNQSPLIDSIQRGERGPRKIVGYVLVRRDKYKAVSQSRGVSVSTHDPVLVIISEDNRTY